MANTPEEVVGAHQTPSDVNDLTSPPAVDGRTIRAIQRREQRRNAILAAAKQVFWAKGYHDASVHDIIDQARIARGTFYLYFNNKREIFAELLATFLELIRQSVRRISLDPADGPPLMQMRANFRRVMTVVIAHEDLASITLRHASTVDPEIGGQVQAFFDQIVALIERSVSIGRQLGIAREDCDDHIIAISALGALREILSRMLDARNRQESKRARESPSTGVLTDIERLADELLTFFVRGVFT
ncbi:MAG: TetR/AcrR family transcriptional regulator [Nannocystaceae bacterium]